MHNNDLQDVSAAVEKNHRKSIWKRIVSVLACIVVFCTTYALILPALTLEKDAECGLEEHTHTEACYIRDDSSAPEVLVCNAETLGLHVHTDACIGIDGEYICGYSDFVIHSHNEYCYDESGMLVCTLPEIFPHIHNDSCYPITEDIGAELNGGLDGVLDNGFANVSGHIHTDECYVNELGELICTLPTEAAHVHTDECYITTNQLTCPLPEGEGHIHGEGCFDEGGALVCTVLESAGHTHTPECYTASSELICTIAEGEQIHVHTDECYAQSKVLVCGISEEPLFIENGSALPSPEGDGDDGFAAEGSIGEPSFENNITTEPFVTDDTVENGDRGEPICGMTEIIPHCHDDSCFDGNGMLICGMTEVLEHIHAQECMGKQDNSDELTCTIAEGDGAHIHTVEGGCFDEEGTLICELEESEGHVHSAICYGNWTLVCGIEEHTHTEECYSSDEPAADPARIAYCGKEEHTHAGDCINENGVVVCLIEEHKHSEECYIDTSAEAETFCGKIEHIHADECFDENGVLICALEEHVHDEECYADNAFDDLLVSNHVAVAVIVEDNLFISDMPMLMSNAMLYANNGTEIDFKDNIDEVVLQHNVNNVWVNAEPGYTIKKGEQVRFVIHYLLEGKTLTDTDTIYYKLPAAFINVNQQDGDVYDGDIKIGTYTIRDGVVHIKFDPDFVNKNKDGNKIKGFVSIDASLDANQSESEKVTVSFNDKLIVDYNFDNSDQDWSNVTPEKTGVILDRANGVIQYTIKVKTDDKGTTHTVDVKDTMEGVSLVGDISGITVTLNGENVTCDKTVTTDGFEIKNLPSMLPNTEYVITYKAKLPESLADSTVDVDTNNKVVASTKRNDNNVVDKSSEFPIKFEQNYISKSGSLNGDKIDWKITINDGKHDISGWKLNDELNGSLLSQLPIIIRDSKNNEYKIESWPYVFPADSTDVYTIEYSTPITPTLDASVETNKATIGKDNETPAESTAVVPLPEVDPVTKDAISIMPSSDGNAIVEWQVTVAADKGDIPANWYYEDWLNFDWQGDQYISDSQFSYLETAIRKAIPTEKYSYTIEKLQSNNLTRGFRINFTTPLKKGESFTFKYYSTGVLTDSERKFINKGNVNGKKEKQAEIKYYPTLRKTDANNENGGSNTKHDYFDQNLDKNGTLKWNIYVSPPADYTSGDLKLVEELPDGVTLERFYVKIQDLWWDADVTAQGDHPINNHQEYKYITNIDGNKITIIIPEATVKLQTPNKFNFEVKAKINDNVEFEVAEDGKPTASFINTAKLMYGDDRELDTKTQTQTITKDETKPPISKSVGKPKDNIIPYTVIVNPDGKDLVEGTDKLTFTDTATFWLSSDQYNDNTTLKFINSSLKVYNLSKLDDSGNPTEISPSYLKLHVRTERNKTDWGGSSVSIFTLALPDETPIKIVYNYKVESTNYNTNSKLENTAAIEGVADLPQGNKTSVQVDIVQSAAGASTGGIEFIKVDSEAYGVTLPQVTFHLYKYNNETKQYELAKDKEGNPGIYVTDSNGSIKINDIVFNTAYYLEEVNPPSGYYPLDDYWYFMMPSKETEKYPRCAPDDFAGSEYNGGQSIYIPSEKQTTEIEVEKQWLEDKTGKNVTSTRTGEIKFRLMRYVLDEKPGNKKDKVSVSCRTNSYYPKFTIVPTDGSNPENNGYVPYGSTVTLTIKTSNAEEDEGLKPPILVISNGGEVTMSKVNCNTFTYTFEARDDTEIIVTHLTSDIQGDYNQGKGWLFDQAQSQNSITFIPPTPVELIPEAVPGYETVTISSDNNWRVSIKDLPKTGTNPDTGKTVYYTYFVEEIPDDGIADIVGTVYSENNATGITTGTLTITNTVDTAPKHELPQTGGSGTTKFLSAGAGLMLIALLALLRKPKISAGGGCRSS